MGYLKLLRITYATLQDSYAQSTPYISNNASYYAYRTIWAIVFFHGLGGFVLVVLIRGQIPQVSREALVYTLAGLAVASELWIRLWVLRDSAQRAVRDLISRESAAEAAARRRQVAVFKWASLCAFLLVMFTFWALRHAFGR